MLRPLRDEVLIEPIAVVCSDVIDIPDRPLDGNQAIVRGIGPRVADPDKALKVGCKVIFNPSENPVPAGSQIAVPESQILAVIG